MFKNSIKSHLFASLSFLITITLLIIAIISFIVTRHEAIEIFDSNLVRTSKLLLSLTKHEVIEHQTNDNFIIDLGLAEEKEFHRYEYKTHFQIWKEDYMIYNSSPDIVVDKPNNQGFRNLIVNDATWRSFVIYDKESDVTIEVMESNDVRGELIQKILITLLLPLMISFIPLLLIIWLVVNKGLVKLTTLSKEIKNVSPLLLTPFRRNEALPAEVRPLVDSLNFLLVKLEESMNKERKFIDYASHELRTPLTVIKTKTQFLSKKYRNDKQLHSDLGNLLEAVDRIINLSNQLLILSRIDTENKTVEKENLNLSTLVSNIIANFYPDAQNKGINIKAKIDEKCFILANKFHIEIMLNNLFDNALKYSPDKEDIEVSLKSKSQDIIFSITNKGQSISKEDQKRIFERFYRAQNNNKNGSGIGLSIVKKISDLHEGKIEFTSINYSNSFTVSFKSVGV
jgi:two-component system sensor histidine kinase QseC